MIEEESGFLIEPRLDGEYVGLKLLHSSSSGYCQIWLAGKFRQLVILKCLAPEYREDPVREELLRKEFDLGYGLNHPSICRTFNYFRHPELGNCIEMEFIDGETLSQRFSIAPPSLALFRKIAGELCDAVDYLHSRQIIHRDIKPSNILITHHGDNVKLIDFGLADSDASALFKMPAGTRSFLAPEVLAGKEADARSDIYSVGKVLSSITRRHSRVLRKCCQEDPKRRYCSIREVKDALLASGHGIAVVFTIIVLAVVLAGALLLWRRQADSIYVPKVEPVSDTVFIQLPPEPLPRPATAAKRQGDASSKNEETPGTAPDVSQQDIEALFQEATDLFE